MILDATCGLKEMWYRKDDPETVYLDRRKGEVEFHTVVRKKRNIIPDIQADNRYLPFRDNVFDLVLFDPPHEIGRSEGVFQDKYSQLNPFSWQKDIYLATREMFRVLKKGGFLIFKWSETSRALKRALGLFPKTPLFGQKIYSSKSNTVWVTFRK